MKHDERLPLSSDDPLCSGKKSQPPDVAVDRLRNQTSRQSNCSENIMECLFIRSIMDKVE